LISDIPSLFICKEDAKKVRKGQSVDYNAHQEITGTVKIYEENKVFLGIGSLDKNMILQPKRLFPS
jgi:tRNA U55 pseudouridine synthase TruB